MKRHLIVTLMAMVLASPAFGQVQAYHHRSTVLGDHAAGLAELELARGQAAVDSAYAYQLRLDAEQKRLALRYHKLRNRQAAREFQSARTQDLADARARRAAQGMARTAVAARKFASEVYHDTYAWPKMLSTEAFAEERATIEQLIRLESGNRAQRAQKLIDVSQKLRTRIRDRQTQATHLERMQALQVVAQLEYLSNEAKVPQSTEEVQLWAGQ